MPSPTHTYTEPGAYTITLTVYNGVAFDTTSADLTVAGASGEDIAPTAAFRVGFDIEANPLWREFKDRSDIGTSPITAWRWTFGDGDVSSEINPVHTYAQPGWYWVSLQVWSAAGTDTTMAQIAVGVSGADPDSPNQGIPEYRTVAPRSQFMDLELVAFHSPDRDDYGMASCRDCHGKKFYETSNDENVRAAHALMPGYGYRDERCARCHTHGEDLLNRSTKYFRASMFEAGSCAKEGCHGPTGQKPLYAVNR